MVYGRRRARFRLVGSLDRRRHREVCRRLHQDAELASAAHRNRIYAELRAGDDPRRFDLYRLRFVGDSLMDFFREHILTINAFWPLAGMLVLLFFNKENKSLIRWWANLVMVSGFIISLPLWFWFDRNSGDQMQFVENARWIQTIGRSEERRVGK